MNKSKQKQINFQQHKSNESNLLKSIKLYFQLYQTKYKYFDKKEINNIFQYINQNQFIQINEENFKERFYFFLLNKIKFALENIQSFLYLDDLVYENKNKFLENIEIFSFLSQTKDDYKYIKDNFNPSIVKFSFIYL